MARINLKKFIAEHYKGGVTARDVIREGVTNSIQAGANVITVDLSFDRRPGLFGDEERNVLDKIMMSDNGEGFTHDNLNYFDEICTGHKDDIGGKGVGRLAFLKYDHRVEISSQMPSELVEFRYTSDFNLKDVIKKNINGEIKTTIAISDLIEVESLSGDAAMLDADEIVRTYRAQQARREDLVVEAMEEGRTVPFDDISHLASEDLARFIVHRALVIDSLAKMPRESAEDVLHSAILRKHSDGNDIRENNVWLVDDKFLSYSSIYSDETLAKIVREVGLDTESQQKRKPDVAAFYSKDSNGYANKLVIIEFKKPGADIFENNKSLLQCRLYASEIVSRIETVREVFAFSIVEIDDEFYKDMKRTGFKDVFSLSERVVYNDFVIGSADEVPLHLYVMPAASLIIDAKARNRVFEEVLRFNVDKNISLIGAAPGSNKAIARDGQAA